MSLKNDIDELDKKILKSKTVKNIKKSEAVSKKVQTKIMDIKDSIEILEKQIEQDKPIDNMLNQNQVNENMFVENMNKINQYKILIETKLIDGDIEESISLYSQMTELIASCTNYLETNKLKINYL